MRTSSHLQSKRKKSNTISSSMNDEKTEQLRKWREECRVNLLELEKKSIHVRVSVFEKIINEKTVQCNRMLCINTEGNEISPYKHYTDTEQQCKFIENWNGLNTNQMRSLPKSLQEYENRAKNWLNGRRAINYSQNLFPEMILCAEHYATAVSKKIFPDNKLKQELYGDILLYAYISGICCGRVALYDGHHRASLICENSIKKEGNLKRLLQKYFDGDEIEAYSFPKHLQDAIDYFKNKYHEKLNKFQTQYTHRQFYDKANKDKTSDKSDKTDSQNKDNNKNNDSATVMTSTTNPSQNDAQSVSSRTSRSQRDKRNNRGNLSVNGYGGNRGGRYIGSSSQHRNNPMNTRNNNRYNRSNSKYNNDHNTNDIELPPPMDDHFMDPNINFSVNNNNNNNMNMNMNMNSNTNKPKPQNIVQSTIDRITNAYGLSQNSSMMSVNNNYMQNMKTHRSSVGSLVTKFNNIRRRNQFLEQEIKNYKEQQRLDHERIKLLEDQINLLQRSQSYNDPITDDYTRSSPSTSINHSNSGSSDDVSTFFASSMMNTNSNNNSNDDLSTINMNNLPALPMTTLSNNMGMHNNNMMSLSDYPSANSMNMNQMQMNHMNNNNNMNMNNINQMQMNQLNMKQQCQSPMPLQTLGLNFDNSSYLPTTPIQSNPNQSLFGPLGGNPTGEFELDAMDYTQPIPTTNFCQ